MKQLYYFAYGSNLSSERLRNRVGKVETVGKHILTGWRMNFDCGFWTGTANIVESPGNEVEGILYKLTDKQICTLDRFEGYPHHYQKKYFTTVNGDIIFAYVCTNPQISNKKKPAIEYLNKIIDGCKEHNLTRTYNNLVRYKNANYTFKHSRHTIIPE